MDREPSNGMRISELIKSLGNFNNYSNLDDFEVRGISCDSKSIKDNFIFVAIKGSCEDGNRFIDEAIDRGARAVMVQGPLSIVNSPQKISSIAVSDTRKALAKLAAEFYGNPSSKIKVIGITGTNGKTTVSYLIEALLKEAKVPPAVIGTVNYRFKDRLIPAKNTTPGPIELEAMLADMLKEDIWFLIRKKM